MSRHNGPNIVTNGLVLYLDAANRQSYPGSGTSWYDVSENGNNGTLTNGPTFDSGNGGSIVFDGSNDYADISGFTVTTSLTFNVFVNITAFTGGNPGFWRSDTTLNGCNGNEFNIFQSTSGLPWIRWNDVDILKPSSGYSVPLSTWVYITYVVENGGPGVFFYVNGDLKHSNTHSATITSFPLNFLGCQCQVGQSVAGYYAHTSFYNRALSSEEITQNYNATKARYGL